ncbi:MAG: 6-carboxytetrahydropterin synthase [Flavobacteriales bacterium]|nr:6-carboxytetrahydropterin synthase [Flavobacteriales bacterium]
MIATVIRKSSFNSAHRLHNPEWTEEKNNQIFGKCNRPNYHGHNYSLFVHVTGPIDPETGYVMDTKILGDLMEKLIEERFDHKNLNLDVPEFAHLNPTAENIAVVIWNILRPHIVSSMQLKIVLHETDRNSVEYSGQ